MSKKNKHPRNDEIINYLLRPAKNIERKMLCEVLSRLSVLSNMKEYQYVGFGSTYFADFTLFHKILGLHKLISIEGDEDMESRIRFNQPYFCVDIKPGWSTEKLPEIDWENNKSILWLDYTESLKGYMFNDMATFFNRASSGSIYIISVNVEIKDELEEKTTNKKILRKLEQDDEVRKKISNSLLNKDLKKDDYYKIIRGVINNEIAEIIEKRNQIENEEFKYDQILNILYKDGQAMLTIGGIFYSKKEEQKIKQMALNNLDFVKQGSDYFEINVPHLTNREIYALNKYLPDYLTKSEAKQKALSELSGVISNDAIEKYVKIYRYFPIFTEANF